MKKYKIKPASEHPGEKGESRGVRMPARKHSGGGAVKGKIIAGLLVLIALLVSLQWNAVSALTITETRYMAGNQHTVNGLTAYNLSTVQSNTAKNYTDSQNGNRDVFWGIRVWKRYSNGTETEITTGGSPVAQVSRSNDGEGIQNANWTPSQTALQDIDAIVVRVYQSIRTNNWELAANFTTKRLGAFRLETSQWTVYYYTNRTRSPGEPTEGRFYWGNSTYNSRIAGFSYTIDTTPPNITFVPPTPASGTAQSESYVYVNASVVDDASGVDSALLEWDGVNYSMTRGGSGLSVYFYYNMTGLTDGTYSYRVYANDSSGNMNVSVTRTVTVSFPMGITIHSPPNATIGDSTPLLNATFSYTANHTWYSVNSSANSTAYPSTKNLTLELASLSDGAHNVTVYINTSGGELNSSTRYFTIDTTPPLLDIESPLNNTYSYGPLDFNLTGNKVLSTVYVSIDGGENHSLANDDFYSYHWYNSSIATLPVGTHNATFWANDTGGQNNQSTVYFSVRGRLTVVSYQDMAPASITANITDIEMLNITFNASGEPVEVTSFTVYLLGNYPYSKVNASLYDGGGTMLLAGPTTFPGGSITFTGSPLFTVSNTTQESVIVKYDVGAID